MNARLSPEAADACLEALYRGLTAIRSAARSGDLEQVEAIADALHNLPHLVKEGDRRGWTVAQYRELFVRPHAGQYPVLRGIDERLRLFDE